MAVGGGTGGAAAIVLVLVIFYFYRRYTLKVGAGPGRPPRDPAGWD